MDQTLPKLLKRIAEEHPDTASHYSKNKSGEFIPTLYKDYLQTALDFGAGLLSIGTKRGDHIGLICDNRQEWAISDMGLLSIGAIDVPRGCDATEHDLAYILSFAECRTVIAENQTQIKKILNLKEQIPLLKTLIIIEPPAEETRQAAAESGITLYDYAALIDDGKKWRTEHSGAVEAELEKGKWDDTATIIFTSGTTGEPKGVILTHGNFITQLDELPERIHIYTGEKAICVLPVWHAFERMCEYVILNAGAAVCYSKPIGSILLADFVKLNPQVMPGVPRVFEAIYDGVMRTMRKTGGITLVLFNFFVKIALLFSKIDRILFKKKAVFKKQPLILYWICLIIPYILLLPLKLLGSKLVFKKIHAKLGNAFRAGVSGGGAMPPAVDEFFWAIGVNVVEGYGLTETAPVISVRPFSRPIFGTVGRPLRGVEVRIIDENGKLLPAGQKGSVQVKGGIVMKGYYNKPELTAKVIDKDGWFDTGDLGMLTLDGEITLRGRKKDTIVLRGGENIEPLPIEMRIAESQYISQAVVIGQNSSGQDQRYLAALIVPSKDELLTFAKENDIESSSYKELLQNAEIIKKIDDEIKNLVNAKSGFKMFEKISRFVLIEKQFEVGVELSAKQEIMRHKIQKIYAKEINSMFE
ncbi:MAG: AMP-binding protein [Treponemataceae bacterium]|nr:AMP-binding protein [Treponemataceae bacterium]